MPDRLFHRRVRWASAVGLRLSWVILLVALLQITHTSIAAQEAHPEQVPGEILLGWRAESVACAPSAAAPSAAAELCQLLSDLAPAGLPPDAPLADPRARPEWQAAQRSLAALTGLEVRDLLLPHAVARLGVTPGSEAAEIARLRTLPWVAYAEPNHIARAADASYPADPYIGAQWNMRRIGAPAAWAVTQGSASIIVAVLDSGVDLGHPEFAGRLMLGKNYLNPSLSPSDDYGHGTHVAGLIAANANNALGISGLAPGVRLLPLKVLNNEGVGTYFNIAAAIRDATDLNVRIINLSLGGFATDQTLLNAVNYALNRGRLVVAAAGNCAQGGANCVGSNPNYYPAAYPGVLAVAASDRFDNWASYSGYKPYVGLAAPGGIQTDQIWSTWRMTEGGYNYLIGTSVATPLVSAAAALVWTAQPVASAPEVISILQTTANEVGAQPYVNGRNDYFGYGRLNIADAVRLALPPSLTPVSAPQRFLTTDPAVSSVRGVTLLNPSQQPVQWQAAVTLGAEWLSVDLSSGQATYSNPGNLILRVGPTALAPGTYAGAVRVTPQTPAQGSAIDIPVELRVVTRIAEVYLPLLTQKWYGIGWQDPFAPGSPAPMPLILSNDTAYPVALPFPVTFYGQSYTAVWVSDNGLAWFGQGGTAATRPPTVCPPAAAEPNNAIYALALDWDPALGGRVYTHRPNADTFAITWYEVRRPWNATPQSFQLIFQRAGTIATVYRAIEALPPAVIGTENADGTVADGRYCFGSGRRPANGDTLVFEARLPWQ